MRTQLMAFALAGSLGVGGLAAPRLASAQDADPGPGAGPGPGAECDCGGWHGMMGGGGRMGGHHGDMMFGGHGGMMGGGALDLGPVWRLDLSDAQRSELRKLAGDFRRANWTTIGNLIDARQKLRDAETAAQPDSKAVGAAFADASKLEQTLVQARVQARSQALAVLTPEQRQQLEQWRKQGPGPGARVPHRHGPGRTAP